MEAGARDGRQRGYTLMELLLCVGMLTLASAWGLPYLKATGRSSEADQFAHILTRTLMTARGIAIAGAEPVTLCASANHQSCLKNWSGAVDILVFTDRDRNYQLGTNDTLHLQQRLALHHGKAYWRGSLGRPYMRYRRDGGAMEYGSYSYCPHIEDGRGFRQLVVNRVGRSYLHHDGAGRRSVCR